MCYISQLSFIVKRFQNSKPIMTIIQLIIKKLPPFWIGLSDLNQEFSLYAFVSYHGHTQTSTHTNKCFSCSLRKRIRFVKLKLLSTTAYIIKCSFDSSIGFEWMLVLVHVFHNMQFRYFHYDTGNRQSQIKTEINQ